jgi:hypothetical protein
MAIQFDPKKIQKIDLCAPGGHLLSSFKHFTFPPVEEYEVENSRLILKGKKLQTFKRETLLTCVFYMKSGERLNLPVQVTVSTDNQLTLFVQRSKTTTMAEKRRFFKIVSNVKCRLTVLQRSSEAFDIDPYLDGIIDNINLGGVFISVEPGLDFENEDIVSVEVPDLMGNFMRFNCKILRVQLDTNTGREGFGCSFIGLDLKTESVIAKYINWLQREKLLEERNQDN